LAPVEETELDHEGAGDRLAADAPDEAQRGLHRAAGREKVVDHEDTLSRLCGVHVDFDAIGAVLELVALRGGLPGELAGLAYRHEPLLEVMGDGRAEDETARFDPADEIEGPRVDRLGHLHDRLLEALRALEEGGDVLEEDPFLGEI